MIRDIDNYDEDLLQLQHGVKQECFFHRIPDFHLTKNQPLW